MRLCGWPTSISSAPPISRSPATGPPSSSAATESLQTLLRFRRSSLPAGRTALSSYVRAEEGMRRFAGIVAGLFAAAALAAQGTPAKSTAAPPSKSADEIISGYIKTIGGMEKIEAIKTLRRSGRYTFGSGLQAKYSEDNK